MIYPISDSTWVSLIQVVPKKGIVTAITNEKNELLSTGWRMCIDYRRLNQATKKDNFPLLFMDQIMESLSCKKLYCFLDGYSRYNKIIVNLEDHKKTSFICPSGIFAYRRMSFGLCNAPITFERCTEVIFYDLIDKCIKVFMDYFLVFSPSFDLCLRNLDTVIKRWWKQIWFLIGISANLWSRKA